jgi:hypothetical protein
LQCGNEGIEGHRRETGRTDGIKMKRTIWTRMWRRCGGQRMKRIKRKMKRKVKRRMKRRTKRWIKSRSRGKGAGEEDSQGEDKRKRRGRGERNMGTCFI